MTREEAKQNLIALGIEEPTDAQVTNYLNQFHSNRPAPAPNPNPAPKPEPQPQPTPAPVQIHSRTQIRHHRTMTRLRSLENRLIHCRKRISKKTFGHMQLKKV